MNTENQKMLNSVRNALNSDDLIFIGLVGDVDGNNVNFMSNSEDMDLVNAFVIETCLRNLLRRDRLDALIDPNEKDVAEFGVDVVKAGQKIVRKKFHEIGKSVDNDNLVNVFNVNSKKHAASIAIDVSDPRNLESNDFFKSMPEGLKQKIRRMIGGTAG
jgi:hypothetical protein